MKKTNKIIILILCVILLISSTFNISFAVTQDDANQVKEKINETEKQRQAVEASMSEVMKEIQALEGDIAAVEFNLQTLQTDLRELEGSILTLQENLNNAIKEYEERRETARSRMLAQYKYGNTTFLDVLLHSTSLTDFLSNYYMVEQILNVDEDFLDELEKEREQIEKDKVELEEKKQKVETEKKEVEKQKVSLTNKKNEKNKKVATLGTQEAELQKQKEEYYAEYNKIQEELSRIARENAKNTTASYTGGILQFPCPNYAFVSSGFGGRSSPLAGGSSYHKGVDLAASIGSSIVAAEAGTVISVYSGCTHNYGKSRSCGCGGGFGNYLMVSHGNGLVTIYAHCTTIYASTGQNVNRGDLIATVGTTGASTGGHLHFGVLLNGTYVDPAPYIGL